MTISDLVYTFPTLRGVEGGHVIYIYIMSGLAHIMDTYIFLFKRLPRNQGASPGPFRLVTFAIFFVGGRPLRCAVTTSFLVQMQTIQLAKAIEYLTKDSPSISNGSRGNHFDLYESKGATERLTSI